MANWRDNVSRMAQSAVSKSKELAETTRLNVEIGNLQQQIRDCHQQLGEYICAHPALLLENGDDNVRQIMDCIAKAEAQIAETRQQLLTVRNLCLCPQCGKECELTASFCVSCGCRLR